MSIAFVGILHKQNNDLLKKKLSLKGVWGKGIVYFGWKKLNVIMIIS